MTTIFRPGKREQRADRLRSPLGVGIIAVVENVHAAAFDELQPMGNGNDLRDPLRDFLLRQTHFRREQRRQRDIFRRVSAEQTGLRADLFFPGKAEGKGGRVRAQFDFGQQGVEIGVHAFFLV